MAIKEPSAWTKPLGQSADTETLEQVSDTHASFEGLFPEIMETPVNAGGIPPKRTEFNALFKSIGEHLYYLQQGGIFEYSSVREYPKNAMVAYNGEVYKCLANCIDKTPTNTAYWSKIITEDALDTTINDFTQFNVTESAPDPSALKNGAGVLYKAQDLISVNTTSPDDVELDDFNKLIISEDEPDMADITTETGVLYNSKDLL